MCSPSVQHPSSRVMSYPQFRILRISGAAFYKTIHYSPEIVPWRSHLEVLTNPQNPLFYKYRDKFAKLKPDILRWRVITNTSTKALPKAVARERLRRRHTEAIRQALKEKGFDKDGQPLDPDFKSSSKAQVLYGTFEVHIHGGVGLHTAFSTLVNDARFVVDAICKERRNEAGRISGSTFNRFHTGN